MSFSWRHLKPNHAKRQTAISRAAVSIGAQGIPGGRVGQASARRQKSIVYNGGIGWPYLKGITVSQQGIGEAGTKAVSLERPKIDKNTAK